MNIAPGVRLGPYEIVAPIGAGGMGEVYRARDTRLDRTVAIKVLPAALAQSSQLRLRFEREARAISALAHPNICTLHDVGSHDGVEFLVMEHLEGETLADRLARGPLPVADALRYAVEVADALDRAHRQGIVHRDLKPGNVMITKGGAKLLDFGLARSIDTEVVGADSETIAQLTSAKPLTEEGTIVGTVQYMAPEQLEGRPADARTDIFAFGALLYEMLTGKRAFGGTSRASVIASILASEPQPVSAIQPLTPRALERIVRLCLMKDPDARWQSIHDVKLELQDLSVTEEDRPRAGHPWMGWAAAALVAVAAIAWIAYERSRREVPPTLRFALRPPANTGFDTVNAPAVVSPDGRTIAAGIDEGPTYGRIVLRRLGSPNLEVIRGTEGAYDLFWSDDGRQLGFFQAGKLRRYDLASSSIVTICTASDGRGATWAGDTIIFSPGYVGGLMRVAAAGGTPQPLTKLDTSRKETAHLRPSFLPDGKRFLFVARSTDETHSGLYIGSLDSTGVRRVRDISTPAIFNGGRLLYVQDGTLLAQPFDPGEAKTTGPATAVARNVGYTLQYELPLFSAGGATLVFHGTEGTGRDPLVRIDGRGTRVPLGHPGENLDLSRDGSRLAYMVVDGQRNPDIWVHDLRRGIRSRVTFDTAVEVGPVWSPDGRRLAYELIGEKGSSIRIGSSSGADRAETVLENAGPVEPIDWSSDGRTLLIERFGQESRVDLVTYDLTTRKLTPFAATRFDENSGRFSPDGKWIAYSSDESGMEELYLQPFPPDGTKVQITSGGGSSPRWTNGGRTLFYVQRDGTLVSVPIQGIEVGPVRPFQRISTVDYVMTPDGSESIFSRARRASSEQPLEVVVNWRSR